MSAASTSTLPDHWGQSSPSLALALKNSGILEGVLVQDQVRKLRGVVEASGLAGAVNSGVAAKISPKLLEAAEKNLGLSTLTGTVNPRILEAAEKHLGLTGCFSSLSDGEDFRRFKGRAERAGAKAAGSTGLGATLGLMDPSRVGNDLAKMQRLAPSDFRTVVGKGVVAPDWMMSKTAADALGSRGVVVGSERSRPLRPHELEDRAPVSYNPLVLPEPTLDDLLTRGEPTSVGEEIAARTVRGQQKVVVDFLDDCGLGAEVSELEAVEYRLHQRTERDRQHAAFAARLLLRSVADSLFPPRSGLWTDRRGEPHDVGPEKVANRFAAYVDERLGAKLNRHERRAFQADLDAVANWVGGGAHGVHSVYEAEIAFGRLMNVLVHAARAFRAGPSH